MWVPTRRSPTHSTNVPSTLTIQWFIDSKNTLQHSLRDIKQTQPHMSVFDTNFNVIAILIIHFNLIKKAMPAHCTHLNAFLSRYTVRGYSIFVHASLSHIYLPTYTQLHRHTHTHSSLIIVLLMATTTGGTSQALFGPHSRIFHCFKSTKGKKHFSPAAR